MEAGIIDAFAIDADSPRTAAYADAGIGDTLPFDTGLVVRAPQVRAGVIDTAPIATTLTLGAPNAGTGRDALAIATELAIQTDHTDTEVLDALASFADMAGVASQTVAVVLYTPTEETGEALAALNRPTQVDTLTFLTHLPFWTLHVTAWTEHAEAIDTDLVRRAGKLTCGAGKSALTVHTDRALLGTDGIFEALVDQSIAVIVAPVAHLWIPARSLTLTPFTVDTDLVARTARSLAVSNEVIVDDAVTVIVDAVTLLGFRTDAPHTFEASQDAGEDARLAGADIAAAGRPSTGIVLVGFAITVVIETVTHLVDGSSLSGTDQLCCDALFDAHLALTHVRTARTPALWVELVDVTVTVIVEPVAELVSWQGSVTTNPRAGGAVLDTRPADGGTGSRQALIDVSIAVVIDVVTQLELGEWRVAVYPGTEEADLCADVAFARTVLRKALVDIAVAVVVHTIADLDLGIGSVTVAP